MSLRTQDWEFETGEKLELGIGKRWRSQCMAIFGKILWKWA